MTGRDLARTWLHCDFITINGEKISKSLGNIYTLSDLAERGFSAMDYKRWVLSGHYQGTRNFTFESLEAAKQRRLNWRNRIALLHQSGRGLTEPTFSSSGLEFSSTSYAGTPAEPTRPVLDTINNNLNSPEAFALIDNSELSMQDWVMIDELFGLNLIDDSPDIDGETRELIFERQKARENMDFARSDEIRDILKEKGITVKDTADGPIWQYL